MLKFSAVSQIWKKYIQKLNDWDLSLNGFMFKRLPISITVGIHWSWRKLTRHETGCLGGVIVSCSAIRTFHECKVRQGGHNAELIDLLQLLNCFTKLLKSASCVSRTCAGYYLVTHLSTWVLWSLNTTWFQNKNIIITKYFEHIYKLYSYCISSLIQHFSILYTWKTVLIHFGHECGG